MPDLNQSLDAGDLKPGQRLKTGPGTSVQPTATRCRHRPLPFVADDARSSM
ncbi:hypothetical protein [Streptomyces sp. WMMC1477]|uniref:hypothetical protein n=1 Tax=Streptomyces sp. WMMC1477 TaxID=3015155 RepID=UPI0022B7391F|nr:hypothetical protein [Streptomyces sp. WMMC1477]MCZ7431624.1 hypothetical protein [Streptomyces sp. WMMC1477]